MANQLVIANEYKDRVLEGGRAYLATLAMRAYIVPVALDGDTMPASPSDECVDTGYAPVAAAFPTPAYDADNLGMADVVPTVWTCDHDAGDWTWEGVFFTDPADMDGTVMAQAMDVPFPVVAPGQVLVVSGAFLLDTMPPI